MLACQCNHTFLLVLYTCFTCGFKWLIFKRCFLLKNYIGQIFFSNLWINDLFFWKASFNFLFWREKKIEFVKKAVWVKNVESNFEWKTLDVYFVKWLLFLKEWTESPKKGFWLEISLLKLIPNKKQKSKLFFSFKKGLSKTKNNDLCNTLKVILVTHVFVACKELKN